MKILHTIPRKKPASFSAFHKFCDFFPDPGAGPGPGAAGPYFSRNIRFRSAFPAMPLTDPEEVYCQMSKA